MKQETKATILKIAGEVLKIIGDILSSQGQDSTKTQSRQSKSE
ncbi:hypothetical protein [Porphyromonas gingivalis]|nr:hypothetical protein [Porphyromonas gingivalis]